MHYNIFIPLTSSLVSIFFAVAVFHRYQKNHGEHLLIWGIGLIFYAIGGACEAFYGAFGFNSLIFRLWYLFGAILVAAWLGQGTVYLLARKNIANFLMGLLLLGSIFAAFRVFSAQIDPSMMTTSLHTGSELSGRAIVTPGVRTLTPIFNMYGTLTLVGGAMYSAWLFWRKRILLNRTIGNILIAVGAIAPAFGGAFSRIGIPSALYLGELIGTVLMFIGFVRTTTPAEKSSQQPARQTAQP
jgi:hypothetical protein